LNFTSPGPVALQTSNQAKQPHEHQKSKYIKKKKDPRSEQKTQHNLIQSLQQKLASS
jgi:hypothetical protein